MKNNNKVRVGVVFGGRSGEHEISLLSARSVLGALDPAKYDLTQIGLTHTGAWLTGETVLEAMIAGDADQPLTPALFFPDPARPGLYSLDAAHRLQLMTGLDVVFPVLHGTYGEDGAIQGLFELADVAYVGAGVLASALGMDKVAFKDVMRANGIPVVESLLVLRSEIERQPDMLLDRAEKLAAYPLFVKPANLGSSVGITKCHTRSDLLEGLLEAARYDRRVLIERGLNAREIEVSVLGNDQPEASLPGEIIPSREFYSYEAKYLDEASELLIPAPIPAETARQAREFALQAYRAIDGAGLARIDFLLDKDMGGLYLSEVNTMPGFTRISMYPKLWEANGLPYPALVDRLIALAFERKAERDRTERRYRRG